VKDRYLFLAEVLAIAFHYESLHGGSDDARMVTKQLVAKIKAKTEKRSVDLRTPSLTQAIANCGKVF
jgi:hypothetical protein